ncbi:hypothetical protein LTS18_013415 [Coniosporium uncinatum]|uniref:Uncharacterized protein n=1 Tax=Coniosporium uncinatum TaxID=93489 RepID=A0ACC3D8U6_9PEZI|nr:hypothetical protein LTS18_013415 [Coniosporium uncinatum]
MSSGLCMRIKLPTTVSAMQVNVPVVEIPAFYIAPSTIPDDGDGLFAAEAFAKGTVLGEYTGPLVHDKDDDGLQEVTLGSSDQRTTRFRISADGAGGSSMLTYINCENRSRKQNVAFSYVEGIYRRKIVATASQKIAKGRELLAAYSPDTTWIFPTDSPAASMKGHYVAVIGQEDEEWVAKVTGVVSKNRLKVCWLYDPASLQLVPDNPFELIASNHEDKIPLHSVLHTTEVAEHCYSQGSLHGWYWYRFYDVVSGQISVSNHSKHTRSLHSRRNRDLGSTASSVKGSRKRALSQGPLTAVPRKRHMNDAAEVAKAAVVDNVVNTILALGSAALEEEL